MHQPIEIEEYTFYKDQLQQAKTKGANSIAVSVEFLDFALNHTDHLKIVQQACEGMEKGNIGVIN